jgi:hypothetical protein
MVPSTLEIDFQELHYQNDPCTTRFTYFIPLPVGEITFTNAAGGATTRTTCTIPGNPFDLSAEQFRDQVLTPGSMIGPASIADPELGSSICVIEYAKTIRKIHQDVIALGFESISKLYLSKPLPVSAIVPMPRSRKSSSASLIKMATPSVFVSSNTTMP